MGAVKLHGSTVGLNSLGHSAFLFNQRALTARTVLIDFIGLGLHRPLHDLALQFLSALAYLLFDKT